MVSCYLASKILKSVCWFSADLVLMLADLEWWTSFWTSIQNRSNSESLPKNRCVIASGSLLGIHLCLNPISAEHFYNLLYLNLNEKVPLLCGDILFYILLSGYFLRMYVTHIEGLLNLYKHIKELSILDLYFKQIMSKFAGSVCTGSLCSRITATLLYFAAWLCQGI